MQVSQYAIPTTCKFQLVAWPTGTCSYQLHQLFTTFGHSSKTSLFCLPHLLICHSRDHKEFLFQCGLLPISWRLASRRVGKMELFCWQHAKISKCLERPESDSIQQVKCPEEDGGVRFQFLWFWTLVEPLIVANVKIFICSISKISK